jgi:sarcosine oxidase
MMEHDAGFVTPERAIKLYVQEAKRKSAIILSEVKVEGWKKDKKKIDVKTNSGRFTCDKLIITTGSWTPKIIPSLKIELQVTKQILGWVTPSHPQDFSLGKFPCWFVDDPQKGLFYGFPFLDGQFGEPVGMKLALHQPGERFDPDKADKTVPAQAEKDILWFLGKYMPGLNFSNVMFRQCLYTYSKDSHFIIDHLPGSDKQVTIACGFSGHGFKFVPVVGEILADLAMEGKTKLPIEFLSLRRLGKVDS